MKITINRDDFANGLQQVLNIVSNKTSLPILGNVLLIAEKDNISLTTTNLDMGICCRIKANIEKEGSITLPVRKLTTIIRSLPVQDVIIDSINPNQVKITSGGSTFKIMGMPKDDFPSLPDFADKQLFSIKQIDLLEMLKNVSYAQSFNQNRHVLNGVYFKFEEGQLITVSTDGRRLALFRRDIDKKDISSNFIVPSKTISELERLLGQGDSVEIMFNERQIAFNIDIGDKNDNAINLKSIYLVSKVIEGNYPNYNQVIPKETDKRIKIERELFQECVQRASLVVDKDEDQSVKLKISNNTMEISSSSSGLGESYESMAIGYEGPEVQISFNPSFVLDPLKALNQDEIFFEFKDDFSPGVFKTLDSFLCVIMPLRLKSN